MSCRCRDGNFPPRNAVVWSSSSTAARSTAIPATARPRPVTIAAGTLPKTASPNINARPTPIDTHRPGTIAHTFGRNSLHHPDLEARAGSCCDQTADWLLRRHHATLPDQPIGSTASRAEMEASALLREPPPEVGQPFEQVFAEFQAQVAVHTILPNHPRFLAFIPSAPTFVSVLGDWLCAGTNFFAGVWLEAAGPAMVEVLVLDWFKEFLGYPAGARGILTGGGSEANLTALTVARQRLSYEERARRRRCTPQSNGTGRSIAARS